MLTQRSSIIWCLEVRVVSKFDTSLYFTLLCKVKISWKKEFTFSYLYLVSPASGFNFNTSKSVSGSFSLDHGLHPFWILKSFFHSVFYKILMHYSNIIFFIHSITSWHSHSAIKLKKNLNKKCILFSNTQNIFKFMD